VQVGFRSSSSKCDVSGSEFEHMDGIDGLDAEITLLL
jgi:hypothetical protein